MAVSDVFNSLTFAGINSLDYGIYITGEAVYNAPKRSVEFVSIAGRDGDLIIDNGHFENIEVTYPAGCFDAGQPGFADKLRAFRNAMASKKGYQRLTDSYNPDEYRMAAFASGVEVAPASYSRAGEFNIVFNCQPFRYLVSGESEVTVTSGSSLTNPCLFESRPIIEAEGYGTLTVNGYDIELERKVVGEIQLASRHALQATSGLDRANATISTTIDTSLLNEGDVIETSSVEAANASTRIAYDADEYTYTGYTITSDNLERFACVMHPPTHSIYIQPGMHPASFAYGTASSVTESGTVEFSFTKDGNTYISSHTVSLTLAYDGAATFTVTVRRSFSDPQDILPLGNTVNFYWEIGAIKATSSYSTLGHPTYIDCDLGLAYMIENGEYISLDAYIDLGSDLPMLDAGENEITFDNTITDVKIIPRWRQI